MCCVALTLAFVQTSIASATNDLHHGLEPAHAHHEFQGTPPDQHGIGADRHSDHDGQPPDFDGQPEAPVGDSPTHHHHADAPTAMAPTLAFAPLRSSVRAINPSDGAPQTLHGLSPGGLERPPRLLTFSA